MNYKVNENCIGCGMCESICPQVFKVKDGVAMAIKDAPDGYIEKAEDARKACPMCAIEKL